VFDDFDDAVPVRLYPPPLHMLYGDHGTRLPSRIVYAMAVSSDGSRIFLRWRVAIHWNPGVNGLFGVWVMELTRAALSSDEVPALSIGGDFTRVGPARLHRLQLQGPTPFSYVKATELARVMSGLVTTGAS
jgi:hypothetical protein